MRFKLVKDSDTNNASKYVPPALRNKTINSSNNDKIYNTVTYKPQNNQYHTKKYGDNNYVRIYNTTTYKKPQNNQYQTKNYGDLNYGKIKSIKEIIDELNSKYIKHNNKNKYIIIPYGPSGSGKSYTLSTFLNNILGMNINNFININVDLITQIFCKKYDTNSRELINKYIGNNQHLKDITYDKFNDSYIAIIDSLDDKFSKLYYDYRRYCSDELRKEIFYDAIMKGQNIIYEKTGNKIMDVSDTIDYAKKNGYNVIVIYPFYSTIKKILYNIFSRTLDGGIPVKSSEVEKMHDNAKNNILSIVGDNSVDELYIYDMENNANNFFTKKNGIYSCNDNKMVNNIKDLDKFCN
jgi:predicted ABC-type ATPase